ncbi:hypothetical protein Xish_01571 [Xenorhabdus ishibashii]|uniref:EpsG family protein n=1 Tax=Xenorhabdus ishibashii TaxID=1034471 RepID=A0A2D0KG01_9GAMM|nr:hypothetical protein Xish_01571 [Xenorhabdus ishibashii]
MYIFVLTFCTLYLYIIKKYKDNFILLLIPFLVYFLTAGLQYNIGSDYFSYINIYNNQWLIDKYYNSGEYIFFTPTRYYII